MSVRAECKLSDCVYYTPVPDKADQCDCSHTDKKFHMKNPCPLYRKDWNKNDGSAKDLKNKFLKRRG